MKIRNVIASVGAVCLVGLLGACSSNSSSGTTTTNTPTPSVTASSTASPGATAAALSLQLGDCLNLADVSQGSGTGAVPTVACDQPHDSEVVGIFNLTDATFDATTVQSEAQTQCNQAMTSYVGPDYATATPALAVEFLSPTVDTWNAGNREVDCLATTQDGTPSLTSSVQGIGIATAQPSDGTTDASADQTDATADQTDATADQTDDATGVRTVS